MTRLTDAELAELAGGITPGPWAHGEKMPVIRRIYLDEQGRRCTQFVAESYFRAGREDQSEAFANAQAIARVPDLLADLIAAREALRNLVKQIKTGDDSDIDYAVRAAEEVIGE